MFPLNLSFIYRILGYQQLPVTPQDLACYKGYCRGDIALLKVMDNFDEGISNILQLPLQEHYLWPPGTIKLISKRFKKSRILPFLVNQVHP